MFIYSKRTFQVSKGKLIPVYHISYERWENSLVAVKDLSNWLKKTGPSAMYRSPMSVTH